MLCVLTVVVALVTDGVSATPVTLMVKTCGAEVSTLPPPAPPLSFSTIVIWADPYAWIPEAARLLRPGGELVFLANSVIFILCAPDEEAPAGRTLVRPQAGLHRVEYTDDEGVEFHLPHGELLRLLRRSGFEVLDLVEL